MRKNHVDYLRLYSKRQIPYFVDAFVFQVGIFMTSYRKKIENVMTSNFEKLLISYIKKFPCNFIVIKGWKPCFLRPVL